MTARLAQRTGATLALAHRAFGERRVPYLSDEERHRMRDARVRAIVSYAGATVPHYRDLFRAAGIDAREIQTARH